MNFFERELRRFTIETDSLKGYPFTFAGRAAFLPLSGNRKVRVEFVTTGVANEYAAMRVTIVDAAEGAIDRLTFHFRDYWCPRRSSGSTSYIPHIWYYQVYEWYGPAPDSFEIEAVAKAIRDYIQVFA